VDRRKTDAEVYEHVIRGLRRENLRPVTPCRSTPARPRK